MRKTFGFEHVMYRKQTKVRGLYLVRRHSYGCQHDGNCSFSSAVLICNFENISVSANSLLI